MRTITLSLAIGILATFNLYAQDHRDWSYNLGMYEVNIRQYSSAGTFEAFGNRLDDLDSLGVGILWFMPIHPIGVENRLGSLGSYYSVKDYLDVNPNYGTMDDFKAVVDSAHARDMRVIIDWVPNHTSWDNVLTETHPEWYVTNSSGEFIPPPGTNWSDVIELDYSKQELRDYMVDALKFWVDSANVDGFRFDAVDMVPTDFWEEALAELKEHKPDIFLLAEGDGTEFHEEGFHMSYAWNLYGFGYGTFMDIASGSLNAPAGALSSYYAGEKAQYQDGAYRMYFTSNHDENSWYGTDYELFGSYRRAFVVLTATANGMPLIYSGQEAGLNKRLQFFEKDQITWRAHPNFEMYRKLLELKKRNSALWNGINENYMQRILTSDNTAIFAFLREYQDDRVFVVTNLTGSEKTVVLKDELVAGTYRNVLTDEDTVFANRDSVTIEAYGYSVWEGIESTVANETEEAPLDFKLEQNYPNPFNPSTVISYQLPVNSLVNLKVYDLLGREIATLVDGQMSAGNHSVNFNGSQLSSGMYMYRLQVGNHVQTRKMLLVK